jgi:hypothetical protein
MAPIYNKRGCGGAARPAYPVGVGVGVGVSDPAPEIVDDAADADADGVKPDR